jgi:hypothetical protein
LKQDAGGARFQEARDAREMAQQLFGADGGWGLELSAKTISIINAGEQQLRGTTTPEVDSDDGCY